MMRYWFKEPLLHFLIVGGLLFALYGWLNPGPGNEPRVVRITAAEVNWLKGTWAGQWQRPPNEQELRGLVTNYLKEELLSHEARELGLDENDTVVRRRLAQKMEFLVQDVAQLAEPAEDELRQFYDANRTHYQAPARISFTQIYFKTETAARQGLEKLATHSKAEVGDPILLEREYTRIDEQTVTSLFGPEFSDSLFVLDPGRWQAPVASGFGFHLVRVSEREPAQPRPYEEVRAQVLNEWYRSHQAKANEQFFADLLKKYDVIVDETIKPLIGPLAEVEGAGK